MSKITLEITEVVNGLTISETPTTLQGDLLAAASTSATAVSFTPAGGIAATNVQPALAELDTEKMPKTGGSFTGDVTFRSGASSPMTWDTSANQLKFNDGVKAVFGAGQSLTDADLEIYHAGDESYIRDTGSGAIRIQTDGPGIYLGSNVNEAALSATFVPGGASTLYDTYRPRFTTNSTGSELNGQVNLVDATFPNAPTVSAGLNVAGLVEFDSLSGTGAVAITDILDEDNMASNSATALATQQSIKAYVDAQQDTVDTFAEILALSNTTGGTDLSVSTNDKVQFRDAAIYINSSTDGQLDIVADTEIQLAATTVDLNGVLDVSGNIVVGGTVDGRDVASDGTKLDGIEASATADQSNAEIRAAVEAATDSNVFTDADHTKLNGIEASATADQSNAEIRAAVEAATDSNVFTDADHTKLNGVASNATANVGDVTNNGTQTLTNKTLTSPDINTPDIDGGTIDGATVGATTPSTGKFTSLFVIDDTPTFVLNDSDGNEQFKISHQGGNSYISSFGSGTDFGATTIFRNNVTTGIDQKAILKCATNGDVRIFQVDGSTDLLRTDADQKRVGINNTSPKTDLQIGDSTADVGLLLAGQNSSTTSAQLLFSDNVAGDDPHEWGMGIRYDATTNALNIDDNFNNGSNPYAANNSRVTIMRDNGKVGIGTATPTGSANSLHVVGGIQGASMTVSSAIPALNLNDSDGNEQFRLSTNAGSSKISARGTGTGYGDLTFYRSKDNGVGADPATTDTAMFKYTNSGQLHCLQRRCFC